MDVKRVKSIAAVVGFSAFALAVVVDVDSGAHPPAYVLAGGSGDSATGTSFVQPTVKPMSVDPTAMSMGATVTAGAPRTALATAMATPTYKAPPERGCVNNGQCP